MGANYNHTFRPNGLLVDQDIYNQDHQNHIDNSIPAMFDDYSANVAQMRSTVNPGGVGFESLATSLAGEIERLRYVIKQMKDTIIGSSVAQWYTALGQSANSNFLQNGFQRLPNGITLQWGFFQFTTTTSQTIGSTQQVQFPFSITFPSAILFLGGSACMTGLGSTGLEDLEHTYSFGIDTVSPKAIGNIRILRLLGGGVGGEVFGFRWFAVGY